MPPPPIPSFPCLTRESKGGVLYSMDVSPHPGLAQEASTEGVQGETSLWQGGWGACPQLDWGMCPPIQNLLGRVGGKDHACYPLNDTNLLLQNSHLRGDRQALLIAIPAPFTPGAMSHCSENRRFQGGVAEGATPPLPGGSRGDTLLIPLNVPLSPGQEKGG